MRAQLELDERRRHQYERRKRNDDEREQHVDDEGGVALRVEEALDRKERRDGAADDFRGAAHRVVEGLGAARLEDWLGVGRGSREEAGRRRR